MEKPLEKLSWIGSWEGVPPGSWPFLRASPLGPSLPWFILLRESANLAPCQMPLPAPRAAPGPRDSLHHFTHTSSGSSRQCGSLPGPSAQHSFSAAFLGSVVYFQCLYLLASLSLFQSLRSGSPPPTPQGLPLSRSPWPLCP